MCYELSLRRRKPSTRDRERTDKYCHDLIKSFTFTKCVKQNAPLSSIYDTYKLIVHWRHCRRRTHEYNSIITFHRQMENIFRKCIRLTREAVAMLAAAATAAPPSSMNSFEMELNRFFWQRKMGNVVYGIKPHIMHLVFASTTTTSLTRALDVYNFWPERNGLWRIC